MRTFLLSWNPTQWSWDYLHDSIAQVAQHGYSDDHWSCGNRRDIDIGDRFYLIRLGSDPRGIVASGYVTSAAYDDAHWDKQRAANGDTSIYVKVRFDAIAEEPIIPITELDQPPLNTFHWHTQSSGILIPNDIADAIEQLWVSRDSARQSRLPEELAACPVYIEGLGRQIVVNAHERNPAARRKCLEHYGYTCACCDTALSNIYGAIADEFIHVHHLKPLADIGQSYIVDPIHDLVPVCPNCHAIIHLSNPPLTVPDVRDLVAAHVQHT
jgi:5-methylcytosine-specific restriction protein A